MNKPKSGGKSTEFGAGDFISAAMGPRLTVGVHCCCLTPILMSLDRLLLRLEEGKGRAYRCFFISNDPNRYVYTLNRNQQKLGD